MSSSSRPAVDTLASAAKSDAPAVASRTEYASESRRAKSEATFLVPGPGTATDRVPVLLDGASFSFGARPRVQPQARATAIREHRRKRTPDRRVATRDPCASCASSERRGLAAI